MRDDRVRKKFGALVYDLDVSDLRDRLSGISARSLMRMPDFKRLSMHHGLRAKDMMVRTVRDKVVSDPREAWRAVSLGYADRKGMPMLFLGINENRTVDKRPWNPVRKGTRGRRTVSGTTVEKNSYWGRSRAFVLRFVLNGTQNRRNYTVGTHGSMNMSRKAMQAAQVGANRRRIKPRLPFVREAKRLLTGIGAEWLNETRELIAKTFNRSK